MPNRNQARRELNQVLSLIDSCRERPTAQALEAIETRVSNAVALLRQPDGESKRIAFILLSIQESTEVKTHLRNGKEVRMVRVIDQSLYTWGMEKLHSLAIAS